MIILMTYVVLIVLGTAFVLPLFWLVSTSFKPAERIQRWPPDLLPRLSVYATKGLASPADNGAQVVVVGHMDEALVRVKPLSSDYHGRTQIPAENLELTTDSRLGFATYNYTRGLKFIPFCKHLTNTLIISAFAVIGTVLSCSLVAYGLSKVAWRGRNILFMIMLSTMMMPYQVIMIPIFGIFVRLGWVNTFLPLIVPAFLGNAFFIFLLRQFFLTIPKDLSEAAKLDGCSEFGIYRKVIMPLSKPALFTVALFTFMNSWNDFTGPLIYLVDESKYTLSLGLSMFVSQYGNEYGMLMAVSTIVTLPIIVLFFFTQRTFVQGITMSGIKG